MDRAEFGHVFRLHADASSYNKFRINSEGWRVRAGFTARAPSVHSADLLVVDQVVMSKTARRLSAGFMTSGPLSTGGTGAESACECSHVSFPGRDGALRAAALRPFMRSVGSESCASRDSLRSIVVTPFSIPQFTIPKLAVQQRHPCCARGRVTQPGGDTTTWKHTEHLANPLHLSSSVSTSSSSSSSLFSSSPAFGRKARRSISDPADNRRRTCVRCISCTFMENDQCSDPVTRGALSLPHLAKITTPYGFVTLSQSPQMANEEELFLQNDYQSWTKDKKNMPLRTLRVETKSNASGRTLSQQSRTNADSLQVSRGIGSSEASVRSGSFPPPATASRPNQSFWGVLRKHLSNRKSI